MSAEAFSFGRPGAGGLEGKALETAPLTEDILHKQNRLFKSSDLCTPFFHSKCFNIRKTDVQRSA